MKKLDFYAWHAFAYRADTTHLTREEDFAYRVILDEIFITAQDTCRIPNDDEYLRRLAKATSEEWPAIRWALIDGPKPMFSKRGKWITSTRLSAEIRTAHEKSERKAKGPRKRWSNDADALHSDVDALHEQHPRNASQSKSKKKPLRVSKSKRSVPSGTDPADIAAIAEALKAAGLDVSKRKSWPKLVEMWLQRAPAGTIIETIGQAKDSIAAAEKPLQYANGIVRRIWEDGKAAPVQAEAAPDPELSFAERVALTARTVYAWIDDNGDPETDPAVRSKFIADCVIRQESADEDIWTRWNRVCRESGVRPLPAYGRAS